VDVVGVSCELMGQCGYGVVYRKVRKPLTGPSQRSRRNVDTKGCSCDALEGGESSHRVFKRSEGYGAAVEGKPLEANVVLLLLPTAPVDNTASPIRTNSLAILCAILCTLYPPPSVFHSVTV
jgi:hypothetical protein